jgi:hypothetical protein
MFGGKGAVMVYYLLETEEVSEQALKEIAKWVKQQSKKTRIAFIFLSGTLFLITSFPSLPQPYL